MVADEERVGDGHTKLVIDLGDQVLTVETGYTCMHARPSWVSTKPAQFVELAYLDPTTMRSGRGGEYRIGFVDELTFTTQ